MNKRTLISLSIIILLCVHFVSAQGKEMPAAKVVVAKVDSGVIAPEIEFVGSVYYQEVSELAAEVSGKVQEVNIEDGQRVKKGEILVTLDTQLLRKSLQSQKALHEEILADIEEAERDLRRQEDLFKKGFASEQQYDEARFALQGLIKKAASARAEVERIECN